MSNDIKTSFLLCESFWRNGLTAKDIVDHTAKWSEVKKTVRLQPNSVLRVFYPLIQQKERIFNFLTTTVIKEHKMFGEFKRLRCAIGFDEARQIMFNFESIIQPTDEDYKELSSKLFCYLYLQDLLKEYEIYSLFSKYGKEFDED